MATIPGSQFVAASSGQPLNIAGPEQGMSLPSPVAGAFNLALFGTMTNASPVPQSGYQGVAVLSPSGLELDLIAGAFAVTDDGAGSDTITAGSGSDTINVSASFDTIDGGTGPTEIIAVVGASDFINLGTGSDTVAVSGSADTVTAGAAAGSNQGLVTFSGSNMTFVDGGAQFADTVVGFDQAAGDRIHLTNGDTVATSTQVNGGQDTLITLSDNSTILLKGITHVDGSFFS